MPSLFPAKAPWISAAFEWLQSFGNILTPQSKKGLGLLFALAIGCELAHIPPPPTVDLRGMQFLATLAAAVILWTFEFLDDYIVALPKRVEKRRA